jgi:hypothetical protein
VFRTFRSRLLWSVWLPFLVMAPILGLMLIGLVEERILLPALAQEMIDQGILIARLGQVLPEIRSGGIPRRPRPSCGRWRSDSPLRCCC